MLPARNIVKKIVSHFSGQPINGESLNCKYEASTEKIITICKPYTMTARSNLNAIIEAVRYLDRNKINGALVECGVWRGGCVMAMAESHRLWSGQISREIYLYDTFEGMSKPTDLDIRDNGINAVDTFQEYELEDRKWCYASYEDVNENLKKLDIDLNKVRLIKGMVEDTIPLSTPESIALLRLDTDWYESTKHCMEHLFPLLVKGGVLILDDYGTWEGAKQAVDEYIEKYNVPILLNAVNKTVRVAIKLDT